MARDHGDANRGSLSAPSRGFAFESSSEDRKLAETAPSTSTLRVEAPPITGEALAADRPMLKLATFGFPEELMHGERQKFGLARNVRLLKGVSRARLFAYLDGQIPANRAAWDMYMCQVACDETNESRREFLETVDQFRIQSVVDRDYLENHARNYATRYDHDSDDVLAELTAEADLLKQDIKNQLLYEEVYIPMEDLAATYSPSVAEAVAHAALDIQAVVHPLDQLIETDVPVTTTAELTTERFLNRFEQARSEVTRIARRQSPAALDRDELRRRLQHRLPPDGTGRYHPEPLRNLPLLDQPTEQLDRQTANEGQSDMQGAPTFIDRILAGAFRVVGNLGGVIYPTDNGGQSVLINPWVADSIVGPTRYQTYWQQEFFGDHVVTKVWENLSLDTPAEELSIPCPMCLVSPSGTCGTDDACGSSPLLARVDERVDELYRELQTVKSQNSA